MTPGRTSWWPCDAAEHDRELTVELGEEFGPAGHALTRVLKDLAQQQRDAGRVRTGFRVLAAKCHLAVGSDPRTARALARSIVERAGEIGWLDDLVIDEDGFTARIVDESPWILGYRQAIPRHVRSHVMRRAGFACQGCGYRVAGDWTHYDGRRAPRDSTTHLEIDHVIPLVLSGSDDVANLQALCCPCNRAKGATA